MPHGQKKTCSGLFFISRAAFLRSSYWAAATGTAFARVRARPRRSRVAVLEKEDEHVAAGDLVGVSHGGVGAGDGGAAFAFTLTGIPVSWVLEAGRDLRHDCARLLSNGNDGTLQGNPEWTTGKFKGALDFDGAGDYIDCGKSPVFTLRMPSRSPFG